MWISLWCNNYDAIVFYIRYIILSIPACSCLLLSDPVCSCLFLSVPICYKIYEFLFTFKIPTWDMNLFLLLNFQHEMWISLWCNDFLYPISNPVYSCLFLSIPFCSCLFLSVPVCSCLFLSVPVCSYLVLSVPVCSYLFMSVTRYMNFSLLLKFLFEIWIYVCS